MERKFKKEFGSLNEIFNFIEAFFDARNMDRSAVFPINLVVEEVFINCVKYNRKSKHDIKIGLNVRGRFLLITLTDYDVDPFDITRASEVDLHQHIGERKVGGLGLHLVRQLVDKIDYEYKNKNSKITLTKHLET